jgi:hypothetical protein
MIPLEMISSRICYYSDDNKDYQSNYSLRAVDNYGLTESQMQSADNLALYYNNVSAPFSGS